VEKTFLLAHVSKLQECKKSIINITGSQKTVVKQNSQIKCNGGVVLWSRKMMIVRMIVRLIVRMT
jgi:hypothetical protein